MSDDKVSSKVFGKLFTKFLEKMVSESPDEDSDFVRLFKNHFKTDPSTLPVVTEEYPKYEQANIHIALENYLSKDGVSSEVVGVALDYEQMPINLSSLVRARAGLMGGPTAGIGPVKHVNISVGGDQILTCVQSGIYFIKNLDIPIAVFLRGPSESGFYRNMHVDVIASQRKHAESFLNEIRKAVRTKNIYRGRVLSLSAGDYEGIQVNFHNLPKIEREQIILPSGLLERIEHQTVTFSKYSDKLLAVGRHLKRGLLLHGRPGTGKTLSAMYLAGQMQDRTVLLLTGRGMGLIEQSCTMARFLQPSTVILEDVDLVAEERTRPGATCTSLLFELLNQMDGISNDADVLFILTTNRPDILEPALASRPGRVDQAIEIPLPDAECRARLFDLYSSGLKVNLTSTDQLIAQTEGASAAFIRELFRKAALYAAEESNEILVENKHIEAAIRELVLYGGELTKSLLGMQRN